MKSGLAALVIAMINIHEHHLIKHGIISLLATFGEEVGEPSGTVLPLLIRVRWILS